MRIGLIGAGRIGSVHAQTLSRHPDVEEIVVFDVDHGRAEALARDGRLKSSDDLEALFDGADGLIIASGTDTHAALLRRAAEARIPTFCEKPIALDTDQSWATLEAVRTAGIPVQMGFQRRFDPGYRRLRDMVHDGELGTLYLLRHVSHDHEPPPRDYVAASGGIYKDNLIHDFDIVRFVTGQEVEEVFAAGSVLVADYFGACGDVDTAVVTLRLTGATLGIMSAVRHDPLGYDVRIEAYGSRNTAAAGWSDGTPVTRLGSEPLAPPSPYRTWIERFADAYRLELGAFVAMLQTGRRDVGATPEDGHEALRIAVACGMSREENRPVRLEEVVG